MEDKNRVSVKRNHNRVSVELEDAIVEHYKTSQNLRKTADKFGKYSTSISRILKRRGVKIKKNKSGSEHPAWRGGKSKKGSGYVGIWQPNHERADGGGYVYEHTLVWEIETGLLPAKGEIIHHINLNKLDNNIDNLYKCSHREHAILHRSIEKHIKPLMDIGMILFDKSLGEYVLNYNIVKKLRSNNS